MSLSNTTEPTNRNLIKSDGNKDDCDDFFFCNIWILIFIIVAFFILLIVVIVFVTKKINTKNKYCKNILISVKAIRINNELYQSAL